MTNLYSNAGINEEGESKGKGKITAPEGTTFGQLINGGTWVGTTDRNVAIGNEFDKKGMPMLQAEGTDLIAAKGEQVRFQAEGTDLIVAKGEQVRSGTVSRGNNDPKTAIGKGGFGELNMWQTDAKEQFTRATLSGIDGGGSMSLKGGSFLAMDGTTKKNYKVEGGMEGKETNTGFVFDSGVKIGDNRTMSLHTSEGSYAVDGFLSKKHESLPSPLQEEKKESTQPPGEDVSNKTTVRVNKDGNTLVFGGEATKNDQIIAKLKADLEEKEEFISLGGGKETGIRARRIRFM